MTHVRKREIQQLCGSNTKNMKRLFFLGMTGCFVISTLLAQAQTAQVKKKTAAAPVAKANKPTRTNPFNFGVNLEPALPLGDLKLASNFGFGVNGMVKYTLDDKLSLRGSLGYMTFLGKTLTETEDDGNGNIQTVSFKPAALHAVTLKAGAAYMLTDNIFAQGSIGLAFLNQGGGTAFLYTPGIGYASGHIEVLAKYEAWAKNSQTLSFFGLQFAYMF